MELCSNKSQPVGGKTLLGIKWCKNIRIELISSSNLRHEMSAGVIKTLTNAQSILLLFVEGQRDRWGCEEMVVFDS